LDEQVIPVLFVEDAGRAVAWYERLGFRKEWEHQFEPGFPWFVSVARGQVRLYLSEHKGRGAPEHARPPERQRHRRGREGVRECDLEDPDGNRLRVATPRS
jgi:catechol 2,3-dioxygenase-like lactoylglutathione lyase family enzyme